MVLALVVDLVERVVRSSKCGKVDHPSNSTWDTLNVRILDTVSFCLVDVGIGNCNHTSVWLH